VIASDLGSMKELVTPGRTGALFAPGNADDLARAVIELHADPRRLADIRDQTRNEFTAQFNPDRNHRLMLEIYQHALARRAGIPETEPLPAT
jgi:glycosyltransferase involved in cell wall biosynthesis